jgi:hypothetical protein
VKQMKQQGAERQAGFTFLFKFFYHCSGRPGRSYIIDPASRFARME